MATRKQVLNRARALGASVRIEETVGEFFECMIEAPLGHHWTGDGVHELVGSQDVGLESRSEVWADLLDRMGDGVERCTDDNPECRAWANGDEGPPEPTEEAQEVQEEAQAQESTEEERPCRRCNEPLSLSDLLHCDDCRVYLLSTD